MQFFLRYSDDSNQIFFDYLKCSLNSRDLPRDAAYSIREIKLPQNPSNSFGDCLFNDE